MVGASSNIDESTLRANLLRDKALFFGAAFHETTGQLVLFTGSPGVNGAVSQEGEDVVAAGGDLGDVLQTRDEGRSLLDFDLGRETPDTIAVLYLH